MPQATQIYRCNNIYNTLSLDYSIVQANSTMISQTEDMVLLNHQMWKFLQV